MMSLYFVRVREKNNNSNGNDLREGLFPDAGGRNKRDLETQITENPPLHVSAAFLSAATHLPASPKSPWRRPLPRRY